MKADFNWKTTKWPVVTLRATTADEADFLRSLTHAIAGGRVQCEPSEETATDEVGTVAMVFDNAVVKVEE